MKTKKDSSTRRLALGPAGGANHQLGRTKSKGTTKTAIVISLVLLTASIADAVNIPSGLVGLWTCQDSTNKLKARFGLDLTTSAPGNSAFFLGNWVDIGIDSWHTKFSDGGVVQEAGYHYLTVNPNLAPNGGGNYVNEYTVLVDYRQTSKNGPYNSLFQTAYNGRDNDGDLWTYAATNDHVQQIGVGAVGYSTMTYDPYTYHRIVWSVDNGNFFRVYVDGTNFLDGAGQAVDGRWALYPNRFHLFADDTWEEGWGLVSTVAVWNRALTGAEIADMGGWITNAVSPTPLLFNDDLPQLVSMSISDGQTNVVPGFNYVAVVMDLLGWVDTNSIQVLLDGLPVTPAIESRSAGVNVGLTGGGLIRSGSTHTLTLTDGTYYTNEVTYTVRNYTSYEWDFTNGDLSASLGNGVLSYTDAATPGLTSFGTTDGSTVPHINGQPAKYMHVPAFVGVDNGYWLEFADSPPNVGTSSGINLYTVVMDVMVPSPWVNTWIVPFFNTDPYNFDDADFYLHVSGSLGIGSYSATNTVLPDVWYRIAFVADLEFNTLSCYVNGSNVWSRAADGLGGRWALYSNQDLGADLLLFNEPTGTSTHELYLSSLAFVDRALTADELAALGGPKAGGILLDSFTPAPTLASQLSGGGVVISWPSNYVGYSLERKTDVDGSTWAPAAGVTNNAVLMPAGSGNQFFRLVQ